ncbi:MAG: hypothetical protein ACRDRY_17780 [Pseudonocardiaceae bacterium]
MNPRNRTWLTFSALGWVCLVHGFLVDDAWFTGLAVLLFLALMVERWDSWMRAR